MTDDIGKLLLRVSVGVLILLHGIAKLQSGIDGVAGMLSGHGLPTFLAYGVYLGEVVGPILVIIGLFTRIGALFMVGNMLFAFALAHMGDLFSLGQMGGWALELQGMFLFGSIAIALLGAGRYSVGGINGRFN
ncbi:GntR family transcriptional regulator [Stutzerimonas stutzeri]|uniref:GntR family transcriptional regulator n=1 Tax=Stutzerimonas stutzeri TaxID=316 RepID=W8RBG7_STUST|nr:DoxX family protein [Stutzerimonas stutzeri]AHL75802.1 GntR family transcriptional regulator [Stutzerimonas stutzeri]MCQ4331571.1 DoxX family protein [Stutzerimonas stutzeri]